MEVLIEQAIRPVRSRKKAKGRTKDRVAKSIQKVKLLNNFLNIGHLGKKKNISLLPLMKFPRKNFWKN